MAWSDRRRAFFTRLIAASIALVLSLALPFALVPMVFLAMKKSLMGTYALRGGWAGAAILSTLMIILLDGYLLIDMLG
jgi:manganese transport protein